MRQLGGLLLFLLSAWGLANAIAVLKVGLPIRKLATMIGPFYIKDGLGAAFEKRSIWMDLLGCPPCLAFWIGLAQSFLAYSPAGWYTDMRVAAVFMDGCACSGVAWGFHVVLESMMPDHL